MKITQGFQMVFEPVEGNDGVFNMQMFSTLHLAQNVFTKDRIFAVLIELDQEWAGNIPHDQFAVLAVELASQMMTSNRDPEEVGAFRADIARSVQEIVKPLLDE